MPKKDRGFWYLHPAFLLFFVLLCLPVSRDAFKAGLIGLTVASLGVAWVLGRDRPRIDRAVFAWFMFYICLGAVYILWGQLRGNPGAVRSVLVYVAAPMLYLGLLPFVNSVDRLRRVAAVVVVGGIAVGMLVLQEMLFALGILPPALHIQLSETSRVAVYQGYTHSALFILSTLIFTLPFMVAFLLMERPRKLLPLHSAVVWVSLGCGVAGTLIGGRRAAILTVALAPFIAVAAMSLLPGGLSWRRVRAQAGFAGGTLVLFVVLQLWLGRTVDWSLSNQMEMILAGMEGVGSGQAGARTHQFFALVNEWKERPIFGTGFGAGVRSLLRSGREWEYELQYVLLLFHTGLVGTLLYAAGVTWIYVQAAAVIRKGGPLGYLMVPTIVGTTCFLLANATNPYLQAYGQMWTLFLPVAIINLKRIGADRPALPGPLLPLPAHEAQVPASVQ